MDPRELLLAERERTVRRLALLTDSFEEVVAASIDTNADDEHDPEGTTIAFERSQTSALVDAARARLEKIGQALERLEEGTYGACERCGEPIGEERLAVRPAARTCIACATAGG